MNTILFVAGIVLVFTALILVNKFFGSHGVIAFMAVASILANILICKSITLFGLSATLGNILFASNFLATDILTECYGVKNARRGVIIALCSVVGFLAVSQFALWFTPNEFDIAQPAFETLFTLAPRITLASVSLFVLSNIADISLYEWLRKKTKGKKMWLRNNLCTILCNGSENFIFYIIAFLGVFPFKELMFMSLTATIIEVIVALCDTPFLYIAKKFSCKSEA